MGIRSQPILIDSLKTALQQHPDDIALRFKLGKAHLNHGNINTAKGLFNEVEIESAKQLFAMRLRLENERRQRFLQQQRFAASSKTTALAFIAALFSGAIIIGLQWYSRYRLKQVSELQTEVLQQQCQATKGIIQAEEKERKRIAAELHDGIGQLFSAVRMNLSTLMERMVLSNTVEQALAEKTLAMVDESCKEVRNIAHRMMPDVLLTIGLARAIKDFVNKIESPHLKINLETYGLEERVDCNNEIILYRIIQECVSNVLKHSKATRLDINVTREDKDISVTIEDNGIGFNTGDQKNLEGIGLKNILARVKYLKGSVDISSNPHKGTLVAIYIPLMA